MTITEAKNKVVNWALNQVGYHEKASNSGLYTNSNNGSANYNKYADIIDKQFPTYFNFPKQSYEWCTSMVTADFLVNFGLNATHAMLYTPSKCSAAGCQQAVAYYRAAGAYYSKPEVGDQWFEKDQSDGTPCHTGIVVAVNGSQFTVVEGNKHNQVEKNVYNVGGYTTHGFGRPKWSVVGTATEKTLDVYSPMKTYKNGSTPEPVYSDCERSKKNLTGSLNAGESCYCIGRYKNSYLVVYRVDGTADNWKCGYVAYSGGIS